MSLSCPFCHSTNVMLVEASTQQSNTTLSIWSHRPHWVHWEPQSQSLSICHRLSVELGTVLGSV
jgi:hypothetical protein